MSDDFTEIALTRLSKRQQQRAAVCAEAAADAGPGDDDDTVLGSRRRPVPSPGVGAPPPAAASTRSAAPLGGNGAPPPITKARLASAPALPGSQAAHEHYRPRAWEPVIAARQAPNTPSGAPASSEFTAIDHAAHEQATRARARRRVLWLVVAIAGTLLLFSAGILLVVSTLGR